MKTHAGRSGWILGLFCLITLVLFREGWGGRVSFQGIDANYSLRQMIQWNLQDGATGWWNPYVWLGMGQGAGLNSVYFFLNTFPMQWELLIGYATMLLLSMLFMYLFLRRLDLGAFAAVVGSVGFSLAPHFITLIHPAHWDAVHTVGWIPILFYFLQAGLDGKTRGWRAWICMPVAGVAWGLLMNAEVQRGLYISVMAGAYAVFLIARSGARSPWFSRDRIEALGRLALAGIVLLTVFAWNARIQFGSELVAGSPIAAETAETEEARWAFATSWSLHPWELIDSLAPGYHGFISGDPERPYWGKRPVAHSYDGLAFFVVALGLAAMVICFKPVHTVRFFTCAAILATLLAFGEYWPGKPLFALWYQLPMMDKMRAPVKFMCVTSFAMAVLAAYGSQRLLQAVQERDTRALMRWAIYFGSLCGVGVVLGFHALGYASELQRTITSAIGHPALAEQAYQMAVRATLWMMGLAAISAGLLLWLWRKPATPYAVQVTAGLLLFLMAINLLHVNRFYVQRTWFDPETYYQEDSAIAFLKSDDKKPWRVATSLMIHHQGQPVPLPIMAEQGLFITHLSLYHGIRTMENTPQARISDDYQNFFSALLSPFPQVQSAEQLVQRLLEANLRFWRFSGVRYILTDGYLHGVGPQPIPVYELFVQHPDLTLKHVGDLRGRRHAVFELDRVLPLFKLFSRYELVSGRDAMLPYLRSPKFDPLDRVVLIERDEVESHDESVQGQVSILTMNPSHLKVRVQTDEPAALLWNSRYDADWQVSINGELSTLMPANYIQSAVMLASGDHDIEFRFNPSSPLRTLSFGMTWVGLILWPVALWASYRHTAGPKAQGKRSADA